MGYVCPVCDEPQVDAEHLANHVAFTAILRSGPHEAWLNEHVPGWNELGPEELGPELADRAETVEMAVEAIDEEPVDDAQMAAARRRGSGQEQLSERDRAVLEEARELTRKMMEDEDTADTPAESSGDPDDADATDSETQ